MRQHYGPSGYVEAHEPPDFDQRARTLMMNPAFGVSMDDRRVALLRTALQQAYREGCAERRGDV